MEMNLQDTKFEKNYNNNTITISFNNKTVITNKEYHNKALSVFTNENAFALKDPYTGFVKLKNLRSDEMIFSHFLFDYSSKKLTDLFASRISSIGNFYSEDEEDPFVKVFNNEIKNKDVKVILSKNGKKTITANGIPVVETYSNELKRINFENAKDIPESFLYFDDNLEEANFPNASRILNTAFFNNKDMKILNIPKVKYIGNNILYNNKVMEEIYLPSATHIGSDFLSQNKNKKIHISDKLLNFNNILFKIQSKGR